MSLIAELAADKEIKDACKKINYSLHEDIYQDLFVILCQTPEDKLKEMKQSGFLRFWIIRTIMNISSPNDGNYKKKYIPLANDTEAIDQLTEPQEEDREQILELETKRAEIESLLQRYEKQGRKQAGWYKVNLLRLYFEVGNYRKLSALTGISTRTICNDVNDFIKELRATAGIAGR